MFQNEADIARQRLNISVRYRFRCLRGINNDGFQNGAKNVLPLARPNFHIQSAVRHRILDLSPPERKKLSRKLEDWWMLDFAQFRDEVKHVFRADIAVNERAEWEGYLAKNTAEVRKLDAEIEKAEREIDAIVYRLFELTPEEIKLLEDSVAGQY